MRSDHIPMTIEAFHRLPHRLGWKHEYWDDHAHIFPGHAIVDATVPVQLRPPTPPYPIRPIQPGDEAVLTAAFIASFSNSVDYCDWDPDKFRESAHRCIHTFFAGERGEPLTVSRVAVAAGAGTDKSSILHPPSIVGAALIVGDLEAQARLDMLFVAPDWQRRGLATALVAEALSELQAAGFKTLASRYLLANAVSRTWHLKFGFAEEPNWMTAGHFRHHAAVELWRREALGDLTEAERAVLGAELEHWEARIDELGPPRHT